MSRNIYSVRFFFGQLNTANGFIFEYYVPVGKVAILNFAQFSASSAGISSALRVRPSPGSFAYPVQLFVSTSTETPQQWTGRMVLNANDRLQFVNVTAGTTTITAQGSGYLLTI